MPSSRAILADIHEFGLDPKKPHAVGRSGRLVKKQVAVSVTTDVVEPSTALDETNYEALSETQVDEVKEEQAEKVVADTKEEPVKKSRGFQKKV